MSLKVLLCPGTYRYALALTHLQQCPCTYSCAPTLYPCTYRCHTDGWSSHCNSHSSAVRRHSFDPQAVCVGYVADRVALGQGCLRALPFYPTISIIPPINHPVHTTLHYTNYTKLYPLRHGQCMSCHVNKSQRTNSIVWARAGIVSVLNVPSL
jgi:hypothetical protein